MNYLVAIAWPIVFLFAFVFTYLSFKDYIRSLEMRKDKEAQERIDEIVKNYTDCLNKIKALHKCIDKTDTKIEKVADRLNMDALKD